jgi:hypothetical protein
MSFDRQKLLKWINKDPYREAQLVATGMLTIKTLQRIKSGNYRPKLLGEAIMLFIESKGGK